MRIRKGQLVEASPAEVGQLQVLKQTKDETTYLRRDLGLKFVVEREWENARAGRSDLYYIFSPDVDGKTLRVRGIYKVRKTPLVLFG